MIDNEDAYEKYHRLVRYVVRRTIKRIPDSLTIEDLVQEGLLAMIEAVNSFNTSKNVELSTYISLRVRWRILDTLRYSVPFAISDEKRWVTYGKLPNSATEDPHTLAEFLDNTTEAERILAAVDRVQASGACSLDRDTSTNEDSGESMNFHEVIPDWNSIRPFEKVVAKEVVNRLLSLAKLTKTELEVINLCILPGRAYQEVAEELGKSRQALYANSNRAMKKLRMTMGLSPNGIRPSSSGNRAKVS